MLTGRARLDGGGPGGGGGRFDRSYVEAMLYRCCVCLFCISIPGYDVCPTPPDTFPTPAPALLTPEDVLLIPEVKNCSDRPPGLSYSPSLSRGEYRVLPE